MNNVIMFIIHSFTLFLRFWLAEIPRLILHNQQVLTKFETRFAILVPMTSIVQNIHRKWEAKLEAPGDKAGRGGSAAMVELVLMATNPTRFARKSQTTVITYKT